MEIFRLLEAQGALVAYHDPLVPRFPATRRLAGATPALESLDLDEAAVAAQDAVLVVTPQPGMDLAMVRRAAALVVDTRGVMRGEGPGVVVTA